MCEHDALVDIAIGLYKREQVSLWREAEIANINYGVEDLQQDLSSLGEICSRD